MLVTDKKVDVEKNTRFKFYIQYTMLFAITAVVTFLPFLVAGKSFVWQTDGLVQHYNAFIYWGEWLRTFLSNLIFKQEIVAPMWEFGLGYGEDIIIVLSYYIIGDPIALLSVLFPVEYGEIGYAFSIILRFWLSGIVFSMYCKEMKCSELGTLSGALAYAFCSYALNASVRHIYFANPLIYLPLLLLGVEKILKKEKPILYTTMVFISSISNYYFFYMIVIIVILYVIIRYLSMEDRSVKGFLKCCFVYAGYAIIGVAMAAIIFLPVVMAFLNNSRVSSNYVFDTFYSNGYYKALLGSFVTVKSPGEWTNVGMTPMCMLGIFMLYIKRSDKRWLKGLIALFTILLMLPIAGHVFNGFGYIANRWSFSYGFLSAFSLAVCMEDLVKMNQKEKSILAVLTVIYCILCLVFQKNNAPVMVGLGILLVSMLLFLSFQNVERFLTTYFKNGSKNILWGVIIALVVGGIWFNAFFLYTPAGQYYVKEFHDKDTVHERLFVNEAIWDLIEDEEFYRIDWNYGNYMVGSTGTITKNPPILPGIGTTSEYWSVLSPELVAYVQANSAYTDATYTLCGLQSRSLLLPFASAKYFLGVGSGIEEPTPEVPYGYKFVEQEENTKGGLISLYQSEYALPFGYSYSEYVLEEDYKKLSFVERQQAMLQGAVISESNNNEIKNIKQANLEFLHRELPFEVIKSKKVKVKENSFIVKEKNAEIILEIECPANNELYIAIDNLQYEGRASSVKLTAKNGNQKSSMSHYANKYKQYHGRENYLINLYVSDKERTSLTLSFSEVGTYKFDDFSIIAQPMGILDKTIPALKEDVMENCVFSPNKIMGNISLDESKLVCFSLPYSKGWRVFVDRKEEKLLQTNIMYSGALLSEGEHTIELRYNTPYIKEGMILSIIGFLLYISVLWKCRRS